MSQTEVKYSSQGGVNIISLTGGNKYEQGYNYGRVLAPTLHGARDHLVKAFEEKYNVTYQALADAAEPFYQRYSNDFKPFLKGMALGSGLSSDDVNILNGMSTLSLALFSKSTGVIESNNVPHCTYVYLRSDKTYSGNSMSGRNYDFEPQIFAPIARNLTVTVFNDEGFVPTAIIAMPGEIYCPSCVNANGIFMELNAGSPSGGSYLAQDRQSMLIDMLQVTRNATNVVNLYSQMADLQSDYSFIINAASSYNVISFEYSSNASLGSKQFFPLNGLFVSTNFFQDPAWGNQIPVPTDATTWMGVTRKANAEKLVAESGKFDLKKMTEIMSVPLEQGGFTWGATIYQIAFDPASMTLSLNPGGLEKSHWENIELEKLFNPSTETEKANDSTNEPVIIDYVALSIVGTALFTLMGFTIGIGCGCITLRPWEIFDCGTKKDMLLGDDNGDSITA